jgi:NAD(P)-dependent dehydrogenase (short-subunit alcohol dehydrogenase family)
MGRLDDRIAVVSGSGTGIGEGIVRRFAEEGARVVVSDRSGAGTRVVEALKGAGHDALYVKADIAEEKDCRQLVDKAVEHFGRIDVLVNTVGLSRRGTIEDTDVDEWDLVFRVNVRGAFISSQQAVKYMKERQRGSIINVGSVNAYIGEPKLLAYSAAKGALMTFTKNAASYLNRYRIRVNVLNVGWTLTPNENRVKIEEERKGPDWIKEAEKTRPWGRLLLPKDIGAAAVYFASDESECITGSVLDLEQYPVGAPPAL